jgi:hypothetical protein
MTDIPKNCPKCGAVLTVYHTTGYNFHACINCWDYIRFERATVCCGNPDIHFVVFTNAIGAISLRKQCFNCGDSDGRNFPQRTLPTLDGVPKYNKDSHDAYNKRISRIYNEWVEKYNQRSKKENHSAFISQADEYYKSREWYEKREKVLNRDHHICQACLENKATQVHHLSYEHFKNEPLFDLISVCGMCHDKLTQMSREKRGLL